MNMIVQSYVVKIGATRLSVRKDSNILSVLPAPDDTHFRANFACPTGRMGTELMEIRVEPGDMIIEYTGEIEYVNSFTFKGVTYHAFWVHLRQ